MVKQDLDKLLVVGFIVLMEETSWLSLIVVVLKKSKKLCICVKFWKLNVTTNKKHVPSTNYEGGFGHGSKIWNVFFIWWISQLPSYHDSSWGQVVLDYISMSSDWKLHLEKLPFFQKMLWIQYWPKPWQMHVLGLLWNHFKIHYV
jgi:hypothetical protein